MLSVWKLFPNNFLLLLHRGCDLVVLLFRYHLACTIERRIQLYSQLLYPDDTIYGRAALDSKGILDIDIPGYPAPDIYIGTYNISCDFRLLPYHYTPFGIYTAFKAAVDPQIIGGTDLTFNVCPCGYATYRVHIKIVIV